MKAVLGVIAGLAIIAGAAAGYHYWNFNGVVACFAGFLGICVISQSV